MSEKFIAKYMTFDTKSDEQVIDKDDVVVEVTDNSIEGTVEISFDDRNERSYLRFGLSDLIKAVSFTQQTGE